jgi:hypothetical protein
MIFHRRPVPFFLPFLLPLSERKPFLLNGFHILHHRGGG